MIKVILQGCSGRMGEVITAMATQSDDITIVAGIDFSPSERPYQIYASLAECSERADVLLDFSSPEAIATYVNLLAERNLALVVATTGLQEEHELLLEQAAQAVPVFRSGSMSLGINLVQQLVKNAAKVLGEQYEVEIVERHHKYKKDAPSGTALMLAASVNEGRNNTLQYQVGRKGHEALRQSNELGIHSLRGGTIVGDHGVTFLGKDEEITIGHHAYSRQVFATGALYAVRYIRDQKPGLYSMAEMVMQRSAVTTLLSQGKQALLSLEQIPRDMALVTELYHSLAQHDVFIDMISHTGATNGHIAIAFTINQKDLLNAREALATLQEHLPEVKTTITEGITKLTVEGPGMEFQSGVAYKVFSCMAQHEIAILAVTTSESKISYAIYSEDVERAIAIIKEEFGI